VSAVRNLNLLVRFACELAAVAAVVWWGWPWTGLVGGAAVVILWAAFVAPRAPRRLPDPQRILIELAIFAGATAGYWQVGQHALAILFAAAALITAALTRVWPEVPRGISA
jgi:hypothetical protein